MIDPSAFLLVRTSRVVALNDTRGVMTKPELLGLPYVATYFACVLPSKNGLPFNPITTRSLSSAAGWGSPYATFFWFSSSCSHSAQIPGAVAPVVPETRPSK
jgi:hypothetical protein